MNRVLTFVIAVLILGLAWMLVRQDHLTKDLATLNESVDSLLASGARGPISENRYLVPTPRGEMEPYRGKIFVIAMRQDDFVPRLWPPTEDGLARAREYVALDSLEERGKR